MVVVAAVQLAAQDVAHAEHALDRALEGVAEAGARGAQLVVLPECTWPGYLVGSQWRTDGWAERADDAVARLGEAARDAGVVLVVGLALPTEAGMVNAALVWEADGTVLGRATKRFLWDFDRRWFTRGQESEVVATSVGALGVFICADGRMPEVARSLALAGADVLVDPTALVTSGPDPRSWTNPQYEFMLRTRARENGLWTVAANKVGVEAEVVAYCGRSCIIDPQGRVVAAAPPDEPGLVLVECDLGPARLPVPRRPELYGLLSAPTEELAIAGIVSAPAVAARTTARICVAGGTGREDEARRAVDLGCDLVMTAGDLDLVHLAAFALVVEGSEDAVLHDDGVPVARWSCTHGGGSPAAEVGGVHPVGPLRLGVLLGDEGRLPEMPRRMMLEGADLVVWVPPVDLDPTFVAEDAATRALENRVYLAVVPPRGSEADAMVLSPAGDVMARTGLRRVITADVSTAKSRLKLMAPGTDVVRDRQPSSYAALIDTGVGSLADADAPS